MKQTPDARSLAYGAVGGAVAFFLGYLVTYLVAAPPIRRSFADQLVSFLTGDPGVWKLVGWVFFNAHYVDVLVPGVLFGGEQAVNLIDATQSIPAYLFAVPVVLLLLAGLVVAALSGERGLRQGALVGASVTVAYLPLAVLGAFVVGITAGDATAGPDLVTATLLAGLVYPLALGAIGGAVGGSL